jgi:predicted nuclease of predicted toxin-antitoxin system
MPNEILPTEISDRRKYLPQNRNFLRDEGFTVIDVKEKGWQGREDTFLLAQALSEKYFIITHDADFGMLAVNSGEAFFGVVFLRLKDLQSENMIRVMRDIINLNLDIEPGTLIVVGEKKIRIRKV